MTRRSRRSLTGPAVATLAGVCVCAGLGFWQVERLAWKEALIATVEARLRAAPIPAPGPAAWPDLDAEAIAYRPVEARGHFIGTAELHVFANVQAPKGRFGGVGSFVMAPFETESGFVILVNRGFVPAERNDPASRPEGRIAGPAAIVGLARPAELRGALTPADDPVKNIWFTRDPRTMGVALGLDPARVAPYTVDLRFDPDLPGGLPQGGETVVTFPNNHLGYALTWFGLAAAMAGTFVAFALGRRGGE